MVPLTVLSLLLSWVQVSSNTFVVKSSAGVDKAKAVLKELEDFHQTVGTYIFENLELPELPIEVMLIADEAQLKELTPSYQGRKAGIAGFYQRGQDRDFIVLSSRATSRNMTQVVYHELTHYFMSRSLADRPTWLSEGLAEYFATADISNSNVYVGGLSPDRLQMLRTSRLLPLTEFFQVTPKSSYYNEDLKVNAFYAQAWAFTHYLMHGPYKKEFQQYMDALSRGPSDLFDFIKASHADVERDFRNYLNGSIQRTSRVKIQVTSEKWTTAITEIPEAEARMSISEIFLSGGRVDEARRHLEEIAALEDVYPRASYYRGILARISGEEDDARDLFIDALLDPQLASRAAVNLVQMGQFDIPAVRSELRAAADSRTRNSEVYWSLAEIHLHDVWLIEELVRLKGKPEPPMRERPAAAPQTGAAPEPQRTQYAEGMDGNVRYSLWAEAMPGPSLSAIVPPYYPDDLLQSKISGDVILDLQLTERGDVGGVWLVSATPDVFAGLATEAVRQWKFQGEAARIRVVLAFRP